MSTAGQLVLNPHLVTQVLVKHVRDLEFDERVSEEHVRKNQTCRQEASRLSREAAQGPGDLSTSASPLLCEGPSPWV